MWSEIEDFPVLLEAPKYRHYIGSKLISNEGALKTDRKPDMSENSSKIYIQKPSISRGFSDVKLSRYTIFVGFQFIWCTTSYQYMMESTDKLGITDP